MAKLAQIRLAGTIAVTALYAAAANTAVAQDGPLVLNNQLQLGDVVAGQTLNVVDVSATGYAFTSNAALGNSAVGGTEGEAMNVRSNQIARGDTTATTTMTLRGDTNGPVIGIIQARANNLTATTNDAATSVTATQEASGDTFARSNITNADARLVGGAYVAVGAVGNNVGLDGTNASTTGVIDQTTSGEVRAHNLASTQYIPAAALFSSDATANAVQVATDGVSNQNMTVRQRSNGAMVEAAVNTSAGNAWDLAGRATATGNLVGLGNEGGGVSATVDQENSARIRGAARVFAYDYGKAYVASRAAANEVSLVGDDFAVGIDNAQRNTGLVESTATFQGAKGYDVYVGADAIGNVINCVQCRGAANNVQTNSGNISATANTTITNSNRTVISGANAVGNAATFYVSGNGGS